MLEAYDDWLAKARADGNPRTLAVLRLTGLFDRTATADCLAALRAEPVILGLTDAIVAMDPDEWNILLHRLERAHLIKLRAAADPSDQLGIDAHPLVREYFAEQLKTKSPEAFKAAHSRLFDHLCETTDYQPDDLPGLQPLYQAVVHGCLADRQQEACAEVYRDRILRGTAPGGFYSAYKLGAISANLGAVAAFFEVPWSTVSANLSEPARIWLLNQAAMHLMRLGRLMEAVEPMRKNMELSVEAQDWSESARSAANLSLLEVTLGRLNEGIIDGRRAVELADRSDDAFHRLSKRATTANALHQAAHRTEAVTLFAEAEHIQVEFQPAFPLLYSVVGFLYADLLLVPAERAAWQNRVAVIGPPNETGHAQSPSIRSVRASPTAGSLALTACDDANRRARQTLDWAKADPAGSLLDIGLDHLTLARAALYRALVTSAVPETLSLAVATALSKLRDANSLDYLPKALLTAAFYAGTLGGQQEEAKRYLDEAQLIAERGPMPLYLADVHLHRARLFGSKEDLKKARQLIEQHGYWRRKEELEDAEAILEG